MDPSPESTAPEVPTQPAQAVIGAWLNGCRAAEAPLLRPEDFSDARAKISHAPSGHKAAIRARARSAAGRQRGF